MTFAAYMPFGYQKKTGSSTNMFTNETEMKIHPSINDATKFFEGKKRSFHLSNRNKFRNWIWMQKAVSLNDNTFFWISISNPWGANSDNLCFRQIMINRFWCFTMKMNFQDIYNWVWGHIVTHSHNYSQYKIEK